MNLYEILNVKKNSSPEEIKKAYRKASLKHHPDRGGNAEEFKKIGRAFEVLGDEMKRRDYDMKISNPFFRGGNDIFSADGEMSSGMPGGMQGEMPDLFKMFFGSGPMDLGSMAGFSGPGGMPGHPNVHIFRNGKPVFTRHQMKPSPITKTVNISLSDAYNGVNYPLKIERWIVMNNVKKIEEETIYVDIQKGIDSNEIILVSGKGNINENGIQGDIKIFIKIDKHNVLDRHGLNLVINKEIDLKDALVGFKFEIEHLNGKIYTINNTNGRIIYSGYKSVIEKMGMIRGNQIGKLIVVFHVNFPKNLSEEQRKKLKEIL
jgi:DnaJ-class molecular chaperone